MVLVLVVGVLWSGARVVVSWSWLWPVDVRVAR